MQAAERSVRGFAGLSTTRISISRIAGKRDFHVANPPASVADPPVAAGLYTASVPLVIDTLPGSSRALRVGSTPTLAILADTRLELVAPDSGPAKLLTVTATQVLRVGVMRLAAAVSRLGFVADSGGEKKLAERGLTLWLAGLNAGVFEVVRHAGFDRQLGADRLLFNARAAIARHLALRSTGLAALAG